MPGRRLRLLLLLGAALLPLLCRDGALGFPVPNPPPQVHGIVGGSISIHALTPPEKAVDQIEWDFQPESGPARVIAEFTNGNFERPNPDDRFQQRLEKANETTLRVKDLVKEDSGLYTAHVTFKSAEMQELTFLLVVSDKSEPSRWLKLLLVVPLIVLVSYTVIWHCNEMKPLFRKIKKCLSLS